MSVAKISVSLDDRDVAWLRKASRRHKKSVSGMLALAVERMRREEALDRVIAYLGDAAELSQADIDAIEAEWKG